MTRLRLLDLFCGAGGAAIGYHRAGFDVVGVDIEDQPDYPFEFHAADVFSPWVARNLLEPGRFDAVHASPPCQAYSPATAWRGDRADHPDLLQPTVNLLETVGVPFVVENVPGAPIAADVMLCGSQFGLPIRRHRYFMVRPTMTWFVPPCRHRSTDLAFEHKGERAYADAMGVTWTSAKRAREAIPPAYTEHIGAQLLAHIKAGGAAA